MSEHMPRPGLSIAEAAAREGVSQKTIRRRIADGSLPAYKLGKGRTLYVRPEDLDAARVPATVGGAK